MIQNLTVVIGTLLSFLLTCTANAVPYSETTNNVSVGTATQVLAGDLKVYTSTLANANNPVIQLLGTQGGAAVFNGVLTASGTFQAVGSLGTIATVANGAQITMSRVGSNYLTATNGGLSLGANGNTNVIDLTSTDVTINTSMNIVDDFFSVGGSTLVTTNGRTGVGTTNPTPSNLNTVVPKLVVNGSGVISGIQSIRNTTPGGGGGQITASATRGSDANSYTTLQTGDGIGTIAFSGSEGSQFVTGAQITATVESNPATGVMPGRLAFQTTDGAGAAAERMVILSSGNVGIGTASPLSRLAVAGGGIRVQGINNPASGSGLELGYDSTQGVLQAFSDRGSLTYAPFYGSFSEYKFNTAGTERMRLTSAGNVGIGTTNPQNKVSILDTASPTNLELGSLSNGRAFLQTYDRANTAYRAFDVYAASGTFWAGAAAAIPAIAWDFTGKVGVGTTNPVAKLHTENTGAQAALLARQNTANEDAAQFISLNSPGVSRGVFIRAGTNSSDTSLIIEDAGGVNTYFEVQGDGNVGIGTASPLDFLHVKSTGAGAPAGISIQGGRRWRLEADDNVANSLFYIQDVNQSNPSISFTFNGRTGIGTRTPQGGLDVNFAGDAFFTSVNNAGASQRMFIQNSDTANGASRANVTINTGGGSAGDSDILYGNSVVNWTAGLDNSDGDKWKVSRGATLGTNDSLVIDQNSLVGIGTANPTQQLSLGGTTGNFGMSTTDGSDNSTLQISGGGTAGTSRGAYLNVYGNEASSLPGGLQFFTGTGSGSGNNIEFFTDQGGGATAKMKINSSGDVVIGAATPLAKLHVEGGNVLFKSGVPLHVDIDGTASGHKNSDVRWGISGTPWWAAGIDTTQQNQNVWQLREVQNSSTKISISTGAATSVEFPSGIALTAGQLFKALDPQVSGGVSGIIYSGNDDFTIATQGSRNVRIDTNSGATTSAFFKDDGTTGLGTTSPTTRLTVYGLITSSTTIPTVSCNAGTPVINAVSTNQHGRFVAGSAASGCTVTFSSSWTKIPSCVCNDETTNQHIQAIATTANVTCNATATFSGNTITYLCMGAP